MNTNPPDRRVVVPHPAGTFVIGDNGVNPTLFPAAPAIASSISADDDDGEPADAGDQSQE